MGVSTASSPTLLLNTELALVANESGDGTRWLPPGGLLALRAWALFLLMRGRVGVAGVKLGCDSGTLTFSSSGRTSLINRESTATTSRARFGTSEAALAGLGSILPRPLLLPTTSSLLLRRFAPAPCHGSRAKSPLSRLLDPIVSVNARIKGGFRSAVIVIVVVVPAAVVDPVAVARATQTSAGLDRGGGAGVAVSPSAIIEDAKGSYTSLYAAHRSPCHLS